jgi:hypothetical protein
LFSNCLIEYPGVTLIQSAFCRCADSHCDALRGGAGELE